MINNEVRSLLLIQRLSWP